MLFYERLSKERGGRDDEAGDAALCEEPEDVPNVKVELSKDLADVSLSMRSISLKRQNDLAIPVLLCVQFLKFPLTKQTCFFAVDLGRQHAVLAGQEHLRAHVLRLHVADVWLHPDNSTQGPITSRTADGCEAELIFRS